MRDQERLLECETFWELTKELLESIQREQWDLIVSISDDRQQLLEKLIALDEADIMDEALRARWSDLLQHYLAINEEIQRVVEEKMTELQKRIHEEKRLMQAYHLHFGGSTSF